MAGNLLEMFIFSLEIFVELEAPEEFPILIIQSKTSVSIHEYS